MDGKNRTNSDEDSGLFAPESMMWKISREHIILLGGPCAAILQVAHPAIARGVAEHSDFRKNALGRLTRTLEAVYQISFGTKAEVQQMARHIAAIHAKVRGELPGTTSASGYYSAMDPDLQLWVLATLVFSAVRMYEHFLTPLTLQEKEGYLADMRVWGTYFGLPLQHGPQDWASFAGYYNGMISGPVLGSDPICREVAQLVAWPQRPLWFKLAAWPLLPLTTEVLPSPVREKLGFSSVPWTRFLWKLLTVILPKIYCHLPKKLRHPTPYLRALERSHLTS